MIDFQKYLAAFRGTRSFHHQHNRPMDTTTNYYTPDEISRAWTAPANGAAYRPECPPPPPVIYQQISVGKPMTCGPLFAVGLMTLLFAAFLFVLGFFLFPVGILLWLASGPVALIGVLIMIAAK